VADAAVVSPRSEERRWPPRGDRRGGAVSVEEIRNWVKNRLRRAPQRSTSRRAPIAARLMRRSSAGSAGRRDVDQGEERNPRSRRR
jgi:hypothetical protein